MPEVQIDNVSFTYAGSTHRVLHSVNLTIPAGQFVLLAGPSGCGKSTLALALAGLIPTRIAGSFKGGVYLDEHKISNMAPHEAAQQIGIVFQNPDEQLVQLDVEAEVAFGPENLALPPAEIEQRVSAALAYCGMEAMRKAEIFALSGGQKQRVVIAAMLAMQSRVLVLDEPTSDLDPVGTQEVLAVLRRLNKLYGWTIILVEHKIDEVIQWVDRVLLMDAGRVVVDAPARHAFDDQTPWQRLGVSVPQLMQLAHALPTIFAGMVPLTIEEANDALIGTRYVQALLQHNRSTESRYVPSSHDSTAQSILSWEHISLAYGKKVVLEDINLQVLPQEWLAIVGANGAGKTSLASLAMGFQAPTRGTIRYEGRPTVAGQISRQAEKMAYLFQDADKMLFTSTVEQELLFGIKHQRRYRYQKRSYNIDELLHVIDLEEYRQMSPYQLSHGQRKRLAIGALLARYPRMLILDEPTTGQDEGHARAFLRFLQQLREQEALTYIMITHNMEAVARYASRMIVLKDAKIVFDGPPSVVFAHEEELTACGVLPPAVARLHTRLCAGNVPNVALDAADLLQRMQWRVYYDRND